MGEDTGVLSNISEPGDRLLFLEQVRSIVKEAAALGETLKIGPHAKRLSETHRWAGLSQKSIADELIMVAAHAGVPVEIDRSA